MTCIDWTDVENAAKELVNNHRSFDSFAWFSRPDDDDFWCLVYCETRDSRLLEKSNAEAIAKELEKFAEGDDPDVVAECHSHWAVGFVLGYAIRVYRQAHLPADGFADGGEPYTDEECLEITEAFKTWCCLQKWLSDYPVLDEADYSKREYEATLENIQSEGRRFVIDDAPADWPSQVFDWLWNNEDFPHELESRDDQGGYPSREALRAGLMEMDILDATYLVTIGEYVHLETDSLKSAERAYRTLAYHSSMCLGLAVEQKVCLLCDDEVLDEYDPNQKGA